MTAAVAIGEGVGADGAAAAAEWACARRVSRMSRMASGVSRMSRMATVGTQQQIVASPTKGEGLSIRTRTDSERKRTTQQEKVGA